MHKITKHVMPVEEVPANTPCSLDPERWFPDEPKPDPYAVAACWTCPFQAGCARRALAEPMPEFGVWGGYRLAPGPGLERSRAQLAIIAGYEMGPAVSPSAEVTAALADLAGWASSDPQDQPINAVTSIDDIYDFYDTDDFSSVVDLDDHGQFGIRLDGWGSPAPLETRRRQRSTSAPVAVAAAPVGVEDHGQLGLPLGGWGSASPAAPSARRCAS